MPAGGRIHRISSWLDIAQESFGIEREAVQSRISAGLAALRAATAKDRDGCPSDDIWERLSQVVGRSRDQDDRPKPEGRNYARERLKEIMEKDARRDGRATVHKLDGNSEYDMGEDKGREARKPFVNERLKDVLGTPCERLQIEDGREQKKDHEVEKDRDIERAPTHWL